MSEEERISYLREKLGHEAKRKGDEVHSGASGEFSKGYSKTTVGFGSNVNPRKFGKGANSLSDWECVCGHVNKGYIKHIVGGREVCPNCRVERSYTDVEELSNERTKPE